MRIFGAERMDAMLKRLGLKEDEAIVHPWINKALEKAQQKVEARNFDIRKNILKFDNVMNDQRKVIFEDRRRMMASESLESTIEDMRTGVIDDVVAKHIPHDAYPEAWDTAGLKNEVLTKLNLDLPVDEWAKEEGIADEEVATRLHAAADDAYTQRIQRNTPEAMRYVEKQVILQSLDHLWREHLVTLDHLRQVIGWRGMAQRDPLNEYKSEAFELFRELITQWHEAVIAQMSRVEVRFQQPEPPPPPMQYQHLDPATGENELPFAPRLGAGRRRPPGGGVRARRRRSRPATIRRHGAGSDETSPARAARARSSSTATARSLDSAAAALGASTARAEALACLVETFEACGIEDPKREAGIALSRGLRRFADRVDRRPAGAARIDGPTGRGIRGAAGDRRAAVADRRQARILGSQLHDFACRYWIRGPRPKRSSKPP